VARAFECGKAGRNGTFSVEITLQSFCTADIGFSFVSQLLVGAMSYGGDGSTGDRIEQIEGFDVGGDPLFGHGVGLLVVAPSRNGRDIGTYCGDQS